LYYSYDAYTGKLTDAAPYPLGGALMSELYKEACLSVAEIRNADEAAVHTVLYQAMLRDCIARDRKRGAKQFGQMGNASGFAGAAPWRRGSELQDGAYSITYKGAFV